MEWVETTGRTVAEALDEALDRLGVGEDDVQYEVLEEPRQGLFGRMRNEARVRARVRPEAPRAKEERGSRRRGTRAGARTAEQTETPRSEAETVAEAPRRSRGADVDDDREDVPMTEQAEVAAEFVRGLLDRFGLEAEVSVHEIDDETVEVTVDGEDLGLLIGPKGAALTAVQDLARIAVQQKTGARNGRLLLDVGGYRQRRKEALGRFAGKVAEDVVASGRRIVLEPMSPADRKAVHDAINEIDGVGTSSEGEEPNRRVVVFPEGAPAD